MNIDKELWQHAKKSAVRLEKRGLTKVALYSDDPEVLELMVNNFDRHFRKIFADKGYYLRRVHVTSAAFARGGWECFVEYMISK